MTRVAVFASSSDKIRDGYLLAAREIGRLLAVAGLEIVYGGTYEGAMYACAHAASVNHGKIIGVVPFQLQQTAAIEDGIQLLFTKDIFSRKANMYSLCDAVVVLPVVFGTLDELTEILACKTLGIYNKPIVILNTEGFYDSLLRFFDEIVAQQLAEYSVVPVNQLYAVVDTPAAVMTSLSRYLSE